MSNENKSVTTTPANPQVVTAIKVDLAAVEAKGLVSVGKDIAVGAVKGAIKGAVQGAVTGGLEGALLEVNKAAFNAAAVTAAANKSATAAANPGPVNTAVTMEATTAQA
jgi:hypothetical protein